jgi:predicted nucleic acid-binding protein
MLEPAFFDTNVFLYAYSEAPEDCAKRASAREHLLSHLPVVSGQVLQEFIAAALRKKHLGITEHQIDEFLSFTAGFPLQPVTRDLIIEANGLRRNHSLSHWDSTILAAARASGCQILYSEDLHDGFSLGSLSVVNPFRQL